jgi:hypothetical protein
VAKRLPGDVYADLIAVGFDPQSATTMVAIAGAESGYDDQAQGDLGLQDANWGPSFGLFQVRTLKGQTGTGSNRDITRLASSDLEQAKAAYAISSGGRDFTPWSTFTSGAYQGFLGTAQASAAGATGGGDGPFPTWGPDWLPWNWPSLAGNSAAAQALTGGRHILLEAVFVLAGLGLIAAGSYLTVGGRAARIVDKPHQFAKKLVVG